MSVRALACSRSRCATRVFAEQREGERWRARGCVGWRREARAGCFDGARRESGEVRRVGVRSRGLRERGRARARFSEGGSACENTRVRGQRGCGGGWGRGRGGAAGCLCLRGAACAGAVGTQRSLPLQGAGGEGAGPAGWTGRGVRTGVGGGGRGTGTGAPRRGARVRGEARRAETGDPWAPLQDSGGGRLSQQSPGTE